MGYGEQQLKDLEQTMRAVDCDVVLVGTQIDLRRLVDPGRPMVRVTYDLAERGKPDLAEVLAPFCGEKR
jgi:predicted GTPase